MDTQKDAVPASSRRDPGSSANSGGTNGRKERSRHRQSVALENNAGRSPFMAFYANRDFPPVCNRAGEGAIDVPPVRDAIQAIMQGGEAAFNLGSRADEPHL